MTKELPRPELRESAFRRFEDDIAAAIGGSFVASPSGMNARTYIARFRDAVLAFRTYGYASACVPQGNALRFRLTELATGQVLIEDRTAPMDAHERTPRVTVKPLTTEDKEQVEKTMKLLTTRQLKGPIIIGYASDAERDWLLTFNDAPGYDVSVEDRKNGSVDVL